MNQPVRPPAVGSERSASNDRHEPGRIALRGWGFRHAGRDTWALRNLDLAVEPGERLLLAGASGAGKSTLLTALAGLLDTEHSGDVEGELAVGGRVGLMVQDPDTQLVMARAGDDVAFGLENLAVPTAAIWPRVDECLEVVGFGYDRDRATGWLSGGEKQRLVLAGVLAIGPDLLLLDEPTANLDPDGAALVRTAVARAVEATGATLLVVDHRVDDWIGPGLVDRVAVLEPGGGLVADGVPGKVFAGGAAESLAGQGIWVPGAELPVVPRRASSGRTPGATTLRGSDLTYAYPATDDPRALESRSPAVQGISVDLTAGETLAITGPNGSGKSTLALLLAGLLGPTGGRTTVPDQPARPLHTWRAADLVRAVGTVFQNPEHQFLTASVRAELALGPTRAGLPAERIDARVAELLDWLRLGHVADANPFTLSGGEKRRLSVATAIATGPRALILDEPTFGQDRRTWVELLHLLADLRDDGRALGCVSHDPAFVAALADRELRLAHGRPELTAGTQSKVGPAEGAVS